MIDPLLVTATVITLGAGTGLVVVAVQYRDDFAGMWYDLRHWNANRRTLRQVIVDYRDNKHGVHIDAGLKALHAVEPADDLANPPAVVAAAPGPEPAAEPAGWRIWPRYIGRVTLVTAGTRFGVMPTWRRWTAMLAERQLASRGPDTREFAAIVGPLPSIGPREDDIAPEARRVVWLEEQPYDPRRVYQPALFEDVAM